MIIDDSLPFSEFTIHFTSVFCFVLPEDKPDLKTIQAIVYISPSGKKEVYRLMEVIANDWKPVARSLGIRDTKIRSIEKVRVVDLEDAAADMLGFWLGSDIHATWTKLLQALHMREDLKVAAKTFEYALTHKTNN